MSKAEEVKNENVYKMKKTLVFDEIEITEIDLSCVHDVTRAQIDIARNRHAARKDHIGDNFLTDPNYLLDILCLTMGKPFEVFDNIGGKDYQILPLRVLNFLAD